MTDEASGRKHDSHGPNQSNHPLNEVGNRVYVTPRLRRYGNLVELTLGGTKQASTENAKLNTRPKSKS